MAVYQTNRHRCLAVLVSYRFGVFQAQHGPVGAIGGYDGGEGGVSNEPPSQPRVARQLLQVRRFSGTTRSCRSNRRLRRSRRRYIRRTAIAASRCSSAPTGSAVFQAQHGPVGAIGGYDGREGGVWDKPPSQPRVARQLLQVRRFSGATRFCRSNRRLRRSRRRCIKRTAIAASRCSSAPTGSAFLQAQHGPVGAIGGYDGREGGV